MILVAYGTRPEFIKIEPLIHSMSVRNFKFRTLFTGQHKDLVHQKADFNIEQQDVNENRLNNIIYSCMSIKADVFQDIRFVMVQGDTSSALGVALAAFHRGIEVIHLEAGLRTYDKNNPYPEETNRQLISKIANIHFCPTEQNKQNLLNEKTIGKIYVVGNTGLDNLLSYKDKCKQTKTVLITLHRRENHTEIEKWFRSINDLSLRYLDYEFILPIHPNPNVQKYKHVLTNIKIIEPQERLKLIELLIKSSIVITDSGGLQEECSFFNKKCLVCRKTTERPESLGKTSFLVDDIKCLHHLFDYHIKQKDKTGDCPFGDGNASLKICNIIENEL